MTKAYTAIHQIDRGNLKPSVVKPGEVFAFSGKELKHLLDNGAVRESTDDEINLAKSKNGGKLATDEAMDVSELDEATETEAKAKLAEADKTAADKVQAAEKSAAEKLAEAEKLAAEKIAEAERIAAEKIAEAEKAAAEKLAAARQPAPAGDAAKAKAKKAGKDDDALDV